MGIVYSLISLCIPKKKVGGRNPPDLCLVTELQLLGTRYCIDTVKVVHAEDAVVHVLSIVAGNRDIRRVDEGVDCHSVASLESDLRLEGLRIDCTNHL